MSARRPTAEITDSGQHSTDRYCGFESRLVETSVLFCDGSDDFIRHHTLTIADLYIYSFIKKTSMV